MKKIYIQLLLLLITSAIFSEVNDWASRSGFQYLNKTFGIRTISMGRAGTALSSDFARWYNPAAYTLDSVQSINFEYWGDTKNYSRYGLAFDALFRKNGFFMSLEGSSITEGGIYFTDDFGTTVPDMSGDGNKWQSSDIMLSMGRKRTNLFSWGISLGTAFDLFDGESAYAFVVNGGVLFTIIERHLVAGLSAMNWGVTTPMLGESEEFGTGERLPSTVRLGLSSKNSLNKAGVITADFDVVYHHIYDTTKGVVADMSERISYPVGVEYSPVDWVDLRIGKEFNSGSSIFNWGAGFNTKVVNVDLGFVLNKYNDIAELSWFGGVKFHIYSPIAKKEDPYADHKRAVYKPTNDKNEQNQ